MPDKATIKIPKVLYDSLKDQIKGTGFSSVTDYIVYVMRDIVASSSEPSLTKKEIESIL